MMRMRVIPPEKRYDNRSLEVIEWCYNVMFLFPWRAAVDRVHSYGTADNPLLKGTFCLSVALLTGIASSGRCVSWYLGVTSVDINFLFLFQTHNINKHFWRDSFNCDILQLKINLVITLWWSNHRMVTVFATSSFIGWQIHQCHYICNELIYLPGQFIGQVIATVILSYSY